MPLHPASNAFAIDLYARLREQPGRQFRADHPFLFFLRDVRTGVILFMGRVVDPAKA